MSDQQLTVDQFLTIREVIADKLKENSSTQHPTRVKQAESILRSGFVDIPAVLDMIRDKDIPVYAIEQ